MRAEEMIALFEKEYQAETEQISLSKEEAKHITHLLNRFIKGINDDSPNLKNAEKVMAYMLIQKLFPLCEWIEGEDKIIVTSPEKLQRFLLTVSQ